MELTKAVVDCMRTLRRQLRDELAIDIRLSQDDAITAMLAACQQSSQEDTRRLGEQLSELSGVRLKRVLSEEELIAQYTRYTGPLRG
jgi:hypothetical protein